MNAKQRAAFESLRRRVVMRTCRIRVAEIVKADAEDIGGAVLFHISAEAGIFKGTVIGTIGPRGGIRMTHERYDLY